MDYIGVNPIFSHLHDTGRVRFEAATDAEVRETLKLTMRTEGLIPALESTHGFVVALKEAATMRKDEIVIVNMSGRGDKIALLSLMHWTMKSGNHLSAVKLTSIVRRRSNGFAIVYCRAQKG